jgi:iron complex outermembrane receptor protein
MNKWIFIGVCFWTNVMVAQRIDTLKTAHGSLLKEVLLTDNKLSDWTIGASVLHLDSTLERYQGQDLASLLSQETHIRIRNYGALSSSSIRGAGAAHTQVVWNGLFLNSPMNGLYDLSLMPLFFIQNVQIQSGGLGSLLGSGSIGGSIHLNQNLIFNQGNHLQLQSTFSSYANRSYGVKAHIGKTNTLFDVAFYQQKSKNNFLYTDPYTETRKNLAHANQSRSALQTSISKKISTSVRADFIYFYQETARLIPPTLFESQSTAMQDDTSHRLLFKTQLAKDKFQWNTQTSYTSDKLLFVDSLKDINAKHFSEQFGFNQSFQFKTDAFNRFRFEHTVNYQNVNSKSILADSSNEIRYAFGGNYHKTLSKFTAVLFSARQEINANVWSPFLPSVAVKYTENKFADVAFSIGRSYRQPTWNDRYWNPGGNPNLKPEDGVMANLSINKSFKFMHLDHRIKLSAYFGRITDWIIWLPETAYWVPQNIGLVAQKGLEFQSNHSFGTSVGVFSYSNLSSLQLAENINQRVTGDDAVGKQLIYVPLFQLNETLNFKTNSWDFYLTHHFESIRYTTEDHLSYLPAYHTFSLGFQKNFKWKTTQFKLGVDLDNGTNTNFQLVQGRPMPGRILNVNFNYFL